MVALAEELGVDRPHLAPGLRQPLHVPLPVGHDLDGLVQEHGLHAHGDEDFVELVGGLVPPLVHLFLVCRALPGPAVLAGSPLVDVEA